MLRHLATSLTLHCWLATLLHCSLGLVSHCSLDTWGVEEDDDDNECNDDDDDDDDDLDEDCEDDLVADPFLGGSAVGSCMVGAGGGDVLTVVFVNCPGTQGRVCRRDL